jgi:hypothetical protein
MKTYIMLMPHICCPIITTKDAWIQLVFCLVEGSIEATHKSRTTNAWYSEELKEASEEVALRA